MSDRSKKLLAALTALALAGAVYLGVLLGNDGSDTAHASVEADQKKAFQVLRGAAEPPPPAIARAMEEVVEAADFGLRPEGARKVRTRIGIDAWVVPATGFVCVMGSRPLVAGCDTTERTIRRGMSAVAIVPSAFDRSQKRYQLFGLAPDGVERVAVRTEGGRRAQVPVIDNVYSYEAATMVRARLLR
jgi:hypothetical protein